MTTLMEGDEDFSANIITLAMTLPTAGDGISVPFKSNMDWARLGPLGTCLVLEITFSNGTWGPHTKLSCPRNFSALLLSSLLCALSSTLVPLPVHLSVSSETPQSLDIKSRFENRQDEVLSIHRRLRGRCWLDHC